MKKLHLACGNIRIDGFIGVDIIKDGTAADVQCDLLKTPWPFEDNSVDEIYCEHFIEHIPHGNDGFNDPFFTFFNEIGRVLKPGGKAIFVAPYYTSSRAYQDPTHCRLITEATFLYMSKKWRRVNVLLHYPLTTDLYVSDFSHAISEEFAGKSQDAISYIAIHNWNVVQDLRVTMIKAEKEEDYPLKHTMYDILDNVERVGVSRSTP